MDDVLQERVVNSLALAIGVRLRCASPISLAISLEDEVLREAAAQVRITPASLRARHPIVLRRRADLVAAYIAIANALENNLKDASFNTEAWWTHVNSVTRSGASGSGAVSLGNDNLVDLSGEGGGGGGDMDSEWFASAATTIGSASASGGRGGVVDGGMLSVSIFFQHYCPPQPNSWASIVAAAHAAGPPREFPCASDADEYLRLYTGTGRLAAESGLFVLTQLRNERGIDDAESFLPSWRSAREFTEAASLASSGVIGGGGGVGGAAGLTTTLTAAQRIALNTFHSKAGHGMTSGTTASTSTTAKTSKGAKRKRIGGASATGSGGIGHKKTATKNHPPPPFVIVPEPFNFSATATTTTTTTTVAPTLSLYASAIPPIPSFELENL
jgi:hypothetical protein